MCEKVMNLVASYVSMKKIHFKYINIKNLQMLMYLFTHIFTGNGDGKFHLFVKASLSNVKIVLYLIWSLCNNTQHLLVLYSL